MDFNEQTLTGFLRARQEVSTHLTALGLRQGISRSLIGFNEALVMQAAASLLNHESEFTPHDIRRLTGVEKAGVHEILARLQDTYGMLSGTERKAVNQRIQRHYAATVIGATLLVPFGYKRL